MSAKKSRSELAMRPFARSLPMQLLRAREALMQEFRPHLRAQGLSEQQWRVLRALAEAGAMEINTLSEICQILPASLSRMLPNLENDGRIALRPAEQDQRSTIVSLTAKGRALFQKMAQESEEIYSSIERRIGAKELKTLYLLLQKAIEVGESRAPDRAS